LPVNWQLFLTFMLDYRRRSTDITPLFLPMFIFMGAIRTLTTTFIVPPNITVMRRDSQQVNPMRRCWTMLGVGRRPARDTCFRAQPW
jgi:hypothetical protein